MNRIHMSRRAAAALGLSSILLLSACTGGGTTNTSANTSDSASSSASTPTSASATSSPSASSSATVTMPSYAAGQTLTAAQVASLMQIGKASPTTAHMEMKMKASKLDPNPVSVTMSGDIDYTSSPVSMSGTMTMSTLPSNTPVKIVLVDGKFYMNLGSLTQNKYVELSLAQLSASSGTSMLQALDPMSAFSTYAAAFSGGTYIGSDTVNGAPADHYRFSVSTAKLLKIDSSILSGAPKSVIKKFKKVKNRVLDDVWLDSSGRLVKVVTSVMGQTTTVTMSDYGVPVTITAPDPTEVTQMPGVS